MKLNSRPLIKCERITTNENTIRTSSSRRICNSDDILTGCECSDVSENLGTLSTVIESARVYTEEELRYFVDVIKDHLSKRLNKPIDYYIKKFSPSKHTPKYCVIPVTLCSTNSFTESSDDDCTPCEEDEEELTCSRYFDLKGVCKTRRERIVFRHFNDLLSNPLLHPHLISLNSEHVGTSDEIPKWGEFLEMVDKVLEEKNFRLSNLMSHRASIVPSEFSIDSINQHKQDIKCEDEVCALPPRKSSFENINRFNGIELFGLSKFCRNLMRWTNCITKRWCCINCTPHLVIHLPSMSYPCHLRCTAKIHFKSLQNIQIGRLGWLVNEMSQVLYVHPGKSNYETKCILQSFVKTARPDVSLSRLWIIENDDNCLCKDVEEEYRSGCETLFYTPNVYRRVRHLSAGRHGFIIPGVLSKMDVLIACELNTPIVGPGLKFQKRLLNKHYVMSVLAEANIRHPPFVAVRNFHDLCTKMSEMMIDLRLHRIKKWLLRINCGFCGNQSAVICLKPDECHIFQEDLSRYLAKILPERLKLNVQAYKDSKDFFVEMERHGKLI